MDRPQPANQQQRIPTFEHAVRIFDATEDGVEAALAEYLDWMSSGYWQCVGTQVQGERILVIHLRPRTPRVVPAKPDTLKKLGKMPHVEEEK